VVHRQRSDRALAVLLSYCAFYFFRKRFRIRRGIRIFAENLAQPSQYFCHGGLFVHELSDAAPQLKKRARLRHPQCSGSKTAI
jgi:hypothetical protein